MTRKIRKIEAVSAKMPAKIKVAAYARVSSGKEASLHSLSAQVSHYSNLIQKHPGWEYAGVYADEALTGTTDSRAEFQRLLSDCRQGKINRVVTKSISRFARNTLTLLEVVRELKNLKVDVYFEKENIHSMSGDGELMLTILASFAQEESRSVSENCKWRIRRRFADGELVNLRFMFGYKIKRGSIEIDEEQAEIVRMIFDDYLGGMGCGQIGKKLRDMKAKRPRGGTWNADLVAAIIKNEKYTGNALLQKKYVADHLTKKVILNRGALTQYYATNTHPAIIEEELYQKAQTIMRRNTYNLEAKDSEKSYPFTSKIVCDNCSKKYKRKTIKGRVYWGCSTSMKYGKSSCYSKLIPEEVLRAISAEVLGLEEFDEKIFDEKIRTIHALDQEKLLYVYYDGSTVLKKWKNKSRSESWNEEAKLRAREKELVRRGRECQ